MHKDTPISAAIAVLKKEIADRQSALLVLEALVASGESDVPTTLNGKALAKRGAKRGEKRVGAGRAAVEILRSAGRPMHGLREIVPALEAQGYKIKNRAGIATVLLRTGEVERVAPGTFAAKGGAAASH